MFVRPTLKFVRWETIVCLLCEFGARAAMTWETMGGSVELCERHVTCLTGCA